jgi:hypothetical protein
MIVTRICPAVDEWQRLARGAATGDDADSLEEHLLHCAKCLETVKSLPATDPLLAALRQTPAASPPADSGDTIILLQRLKQLVPPLAAATTDEPATREDKAERGTLAEARALLAPPQGPGEIGRLGDYRILGVLGAGGMGVVYRAEDPHLQRLVAIKTLLPAVAARSAAKERFLREARAAAALKHDHIVTIHHAGEANGVAFLVMELLDGESLEQRLERESPLPIAEGVRIGREVAEGLAAAHQRGLIHRDIKPSNIWLELAACGVARVKILDFGLARSADGDPNLTQSGAVVGTPSYMSPEQAEGGTVDARSDLFSLGCVLYRMCTGVVPFAGRTVTSVLHALTTESPKPPNELNPEVPPALAKLIHRLLAKDAAGRPASAAEVAEALRTLRRAPDSTVSFEPAAGAAPKPPHRRPIPWLIGAVGVAMALVLASAVAYRIWRPPPDAPPTPALMGYLDAMVVRPTAGKNRYLALSHPEALPLRLGSDYVRIDAKLIRPAYIYIVWVDTDGTVDLVYPWDEEKKRRLPDESPRDQLYWPDETSGGFLNPGPAGTATMLLLARDEKLPDDVDIAKLFGKLEPQKAFQRREAAWFENGEMVKGDARFAAINFPADRGVTGAKVAAIDDPVMRVQALWRSTLNQHFAYCRGVCFSCEPGP